MTESVIKCRAHIITLTLTLTLTLTFEATTKRSVGSKCVDKIHDDLLSSSEGGHVDRVDRVDQVHDDLLSSSDAKLHLSNYLDKVRVRVRVRVGV